MKRRARLWRWCERRHSLSGRLTLTNVSILAVGLVLAASCSIAGTYWVLLNEVDATVRKERDALVAAELDARSMDTLCAFAEAAHTNDGPLAQRIYEASNPFFLLDARGEPISTCGAFTGAGRSQRTDFVEELDDPRALAESGDITSVAVGGEHYRVAVVRLDDGALAVVGTPYGGVSIALHKLLYVEGLIAIVLLTLLAIASWTAARRRLRPLEDMVETASAISEGDLSRRVSVSARSPAASEVAQLSEALNVMLHQIEGAFATREHATAQMRQFLADASHELRTPLATVRGYLQLYEKGMLDAAEEERALGRVGEEADRMGRLVDELLVLARLEQHPVRDRRPVDLAELARDGAEDLRAQQPDRPVEVTTVGNVKVIGDEAQLRQVVGNLLTNVRTHTPVDAACTIGVFGTGAERVLRIADSGPGLRTEDAARVFDRFFRASPAPGVSVPAPVVGTGLGMSIVQAVVDAHDGSVTVATAPGQGLEVTVRLPHGS